MKKRVFAILTALFLLCACLPLGAVSVSAAIYGDLTYKITDGEVTITDCDENVTSVKIPSTMEGYPVTTIANRAFSYCRDLKVVTIPDSVTTIGNYAFYFCDSLTSVTIPDSVTTIGDIAFDLCTSLTSVTIGDSVTTIGYGAFDDCTSLTDVYYSGDKTDRAAIEIDELNEKLENATWHYNHVTPQPSIEQETDQDNEDKDREDKEQDDKEKNNDEDNNPLVIIVIVIAVLLAVIAVLLFLLLKKKKST